MTGSQDGIGLIADLDGKGVEDIMRFYNGRLEVSIGGRGAWQPLANFDLASLMGGIYVGHFDGSRGAQVLTVSAGEDASFSAPDPRRSHMFSRATGGSFVPYGKYAY